MGAQTEEQAVNLQLEPRTDHKNQIYINLTRITSRRKGRRNNSGGGRIARKRAERAGDEAQLSTFERTEARRWRIINSYNY